MILVQERARTTRRRLSEKLCFSCISQPREGCVGLSLFPCFVWPIHFRPIRRGQLVHVSYATLHKRMLLCVQVRLKVALEVDGPAHFTKNTARPLGHMVLKHRTLSKMGWTVVSVSYRSRHFPHLFSPLRGGHTAPSVVFNARLAEGSVCNALKKLELLQKSTDGRIAKGSIVTAVTSNHHPVGYILYGL